MDKENQPEIDLTKVPCGPDLVPDDETLAELERLMHWHNTPPSAEEIVPPLMWVSDEVRQEEADRREEAARREAASRGQAFTDAELARLAQLEHWHNTPPSATEFV